jgi:glycosyltransferase involved in cell wall biosynthesis
VDHELVLVGGTPAEGDAAEREVRDAAAGFATVTGPVPPDAVPELLAHAAVFCLPSWYEAMPLSVLEAMAAGTPVVATSVGDIPRLVVDEESGLLVPPHDVDALVGALTRILGSTELRRRLGDAGRRRQREHFDVGRMVVDVECALGLPTSDT